MNLDLSLVAAVLEGRDIQRAVRQGANADLLGEEAQLYWDVLTGHYEQFHEVPSLDLFQEYCPSYEHRPPGDNVDAIVRELKTRKLGNEIDRLLQDIAEMNSVDPWKAKTRLIEEGDRVNTRNQLLNTRFLLGSDKIQVLKTLETLRHGNGLLGYEWPWEYLNQRTVGVCPGNLFYFYGRSKSKKTWLLLFLALFYESLGLKVLFFTREMTAEELRWRSYALRCGFNFLKFMKGEISTEETKKLVTAMDQFAEHGRFVISEVGGGIAEFKAEVEEVRPHIVFHDYWKAMADDSLRGPRGGAEHAAVARTVDQIKDFMTNKAKLPCILAGHANREGSKSGGKSDIEHAWSDHIARRVDAAFRVISDKANDRLGIVVNQGRSIREGLSFTIDGTLCNGLGKQLAADASWVKNHTEVEDEEEATKPNPPSGVPAKIKASAFRPGTKIRR